MTKEEKATEAKKPFTGRIKTDKRIHLFCQPFGYPIRSCNWLMVLIDDDKFIDVKKDINCKNCLKFIKRNKYHLPEVREYFKEVMK